MILNITLWVLTLWGMVLAILIHVLARKDNHGKIFDGFGMVNFLLAFLIQPVFIHYWIIRARKATPCSLFIEGFRQYALFLWLTWGIFLLGVWSGTPHLAPLALALYFGFTMLAWSDRKKWMLGAPQD